MHKITFQDWYTQCGDGCCDEYGTNLYIDDNLISNFAQVTVDELTGILLTLNLEFEIEELESDRQ